VTHKGKGVFALELAPSLFVYERVKYTLQNRLWGSSMGDVVVSVDIDAPVSNVFELVKDLEKVVQSMPAG
jgi:hypothetical protein